jgi:tRNA (pseudouridine54-N1)-methyltransferase
VGRRFVVIGRTAHASASLRLDDLPGSGGRVDVLLRCLRAALLVSHGVRRDVVVYLVLEGAGASWALRVDGACVRFIRPDERSLANTVQKAIARGANGGSGFTEVKQGIAVSSIGLDAVFADLPHAPAYLLDEHGPDVRAERVDPSSVTFFVGDHLGVFDPTRARLGAAGVRPIRVGPVSLHAEDAIAVVSNEMDRTSWERGTTAEREL